MIISLLEGNDYDLNDELPPEVDLASLPTDVERTERFRARARGLVVRLPANLSAFFKTPDAVIEALQRVRDNQDEEKKAA